MSGLLDNFVRRRRASASSRLGQPQSTHPSPDEAPPTREPERPQTNGHDHGGVNGSGAARWLPVNGEAAVAPEPAPGPPEPAPEPQPEPQPEPEPETEPDEQPTAVFSAVAAEPVETPDAEAMPAETVTPEWAPPQAALPETAAPEPGPAPVQPEPEPVQEAVEPDPEFRRRGRLRRRARYLRSLREVQLRDLGGFLVELQRFGRDRPDLVQAKLQRAVATDAELRALDAALGQETLPRELRQPGIGGACAACGAIHGSLDRYCATCGTRLAGHVPLQHADEDPGPPAA